MIYNPTQRRPHACTHSWRLWLHPTTPNRVDVACFYCRTSLNTIWPGATSLLHMEMGDFTVTEGTHTAQRIVNMPIDIRISGSQQFSRLNGFSTLLEVFVTPKTIGIGGEMCDVEGPAIYSHSPDIRCILETHTDEMHTDGTVFWSTQES